MQQNYNEKSIQHQFDAYSDQKLSTAIDHLSEIRRKVILLYYFAGFNNTEIGKILNMSTSGIWYQRKKAVEQLKTEYYLW
ncbi:MAG: sigma factor-like helix-turn-helix DNA-binding protein [Enterococcus faecalis]|nr:sigma factor-like helix-turn-helix DNA-binding protein [Enterococcus faecalis]